MAWMNRFTCPVRPLRSGLPVAERQRRVLAEVRRLGLQQPAPTNSGRTLRYFWGPYPTI